MDPKMASSLRPLKTSQGQSGVPPNMAFGFRTWCPTGKAAKKGLHIKKRHTQIEPPNLGGLRGLPRTAFVSPSVQSFHEWREAKFEASSPDTGSSCLPWLQKHGELWETAVETKAMLEPRLELGPQQKNILFCLVSGKQREPWEPQKGPQERSKKPKGELILGKCFHSGPMVTTDF